VASNRSSLEAREWIEAKLREMAERRAQPLPEPPAPKRQRHQLAVKSPPVVPRRRPTELSIEEAAAAYPQVPAPPGASRLQREALNWSPPCTLSREQLAKMDAWARSDRSR
jgi:hypothetical protein